MQKKIGRTKRLAAAWPAGDIKLDPVSKGYDYYGTVVNTAARTQVAAWLEWCECTSIPCLQTRRGVTREMTG